MLKREEAIEKLKEAIKNLELSSLWQDETSQLKEVLEFLES
tara:strand:- start:338 stop:460 length:123 start_codon:yes stop_codon:yes gene_type:complete